MNKATKDEAITAICKLLDETEAGRRHVCVTVTQEDYDRLQRHVTTRRLTVQSVVEGAIQGRLDRLEGKPTP